MPASVSVTLLYSATREVTVSNQRDSSCSFLHLSTSLCIYTVIYKRNSWTYSAQAKESSRIPWESWFISFQLFSLSIFLRINESGCAESRARETNAGSFLLKISAETINQKVKVKLISTFCFISSEKKLGIEKKKKSNQRWSFQPDSLIGNSPFQ